MSMPPPPPPGQPQQPQQPSYAPAPPPAPGYAPGYQPAQGYAPAPPPAAGGGKPKWLVPVVIALVVAVGAGVAWKVSSGDDDKKSSDDTEITVDLGSDDTEPTITQASNTGEGYTQEIRETFVNGCASSGGTVETCTCVFEEMKRTIPIEDFIRLDQQAATDSSALDDPRIVAAIAACT